MAFHTLGVNRALQPWRIAGLRHWLLDCEDDLRTVRSAGTATPVAIPGASPHTAPQAVSPAVASGSPSATSSAAPAPSVVPSALSPQRTRQGPPPRPKSTAPVQQASAPQTAAVPALPESPPTLPLQQWPEAWRELLSRCPRSPVVLWTYPAMREDYGGRSDPARRALLQRLLRDLAMPPGSHAFWPMSAPPYDVPENVSAAAVENAPEGAPENASGTASAKQRVDPLFFHSGIAQLSPMVVVFFGPPPSELGLPAISVLNSEIFLGLRLVHVPSTDILAANLVTGPEAFVEGAGRHDRLVQFLKSQVSGLTV